MGLLKTTSIKAFRGRQLFGAGRQHRQELTGPVIQAWPSSTPSNGQGDKLLHQFRVLSNDEQHGSGLGRFRGIARRFVFWIGRDHCLIQLAQDFCHSFLLFQNIEQASVGVLPRIFPNEGFVFFLGFVPICPVLGILFSQQ